MQKPFWRRSSPGLCFKRPLAAAASFCCFSCVPQGCCRKLAAVGHQQGHLQVQQPFTQPRRLELTFTENSLIIVESSWSRLASRGGPKLLSPGTRCCQRGEQLLGEDALVAEAICLCRSDRYCSSIRQRQGQTPKNSLSGYGSNSPKVRFSCDKGSSVGSRVVLCA